MGKRSGVVRGVWRAYVGSVGVLRGGRLSVRACLRNDAPSLPILADYDWIVVSSSAGKDSLATLSIVCAMAQAAGLLGRVVIVHACLGRAEWQGTKELAAKQAAHFGVRFEVVTRAQGDLLTHIEQRGMFPSPRQRYCTSDHKRSQIRRVYTGLAEETRETGAWHLRAKRSIRNGIKPPAVRILSCMGMRADESPARAKLPYLEVNADAGNGRRTVTDWLPLHRWTEAEVWAHIDGAGLRAAGLVHRAYALGMPRLSCCFCIFAPKAALVLAGRHNPELLGEMVRIEAAIGHTFRQELSMADVQRAVQAGEALNEGGRVATWTM